MNIDSTSLFDYGIVEHGPAHRVTLFVYIITDQTSRFSLADYIPDPIEFAILVLVILFRIIKRTVYSSKHMIPYFFGIIYSVFVIVTVFPVPFAGESRFAFGNVHGPFNLRKRRLNRHLRRIPQKRTAHYPVVGCGRGPQLAMFFPAFIVLIFTFTAIIIFGAGPISDPAIAGAVNKDTRANTQCLTGNRRAGIDTNDPRSFHLHIIRPIGSKHRNACGVFH